MRAPGSTPSATSRAARSPRCSRTSTRAWPVPPRKSWPEWAATSKCPCEMASRGCTRRPSSTRTAAPSGVWESRLTSPPGGEPRRRCASGWASSRPSPRWAGAPWRGSASHACSTRRRRSWPSDWSVDRVSILSYDEDTGLIALRAGVGWSKELVRRTVMPLTDDMRRSAAALAAGPRIVDDMTVSAPLRRLPGRAGRQEPDDGARRPRRASVRDAQCADADPADVQRRGRRLPAGGRQRRSGMPSSGTRPTPPTSTPPCMTC